MTPNEKYDRGYEAGQTDEAARWMRLLADAAAFGRGDITAEQFRARKLFDGPAAELPAYSHEVIDDDTGEILDDEVVNPS